MLSPKLRSAIRDVLLQTAAFTLSPDITVNGHGE